MIRYSEDCCGLSHSIQANASAVNIFRSECVFQWNITHYHQWYFRLGTELEIMGPVYYKHLLCFPKIVFIFLKIRFSSLRLRAICWWVPNVWRNLLANSPEIMKLWYAVLWENHKPVTWVNYEFQNIKFYCSYLTTLFQMYGVIINFELATRQSELFCATSDSKSKCLPFLSYYNCKSSFHSLKWYKPFI